MESVNSAALRKDKKYLTWLHRQKKLQFSQSSSSLHILIHDIVLLVVKNYIPFIYFIAHRVLRFNLKRIKYVFDRDFSERLNLFWIIGIFFMSFSRDCFYSHKSIYHVKFVHYTILTYFSPISSSFLNHSFFDVFGGHRKVALE